MSEDSDTFDPLDGGTAVLLSVFALYGTAVVIAFRPRQWKGHPDPAVGARRS